MNRKRSFLLGLISAFMLTGSAQDFYDITTHYIKNAGFDTQFDYDLSATGDIMNTVKSINGWTLDTNSKSVLTVGAVFQFGTQATFYNVNIPSTGSDNTPNGGCLTLCAALKNELTFFQNVYLPAGQYKMVVSYYNCNPDAMVGTSTTAWSVSIANHATSSLESFGTMEWLTDTISFTLEEPTKGQLKLGFKSAGGLTNKSAMLAIDYVKLLRNSPYGEQDDLVPAPVVKSDLRYARGATMAFGRIKSVSGEDVDERGFCWSESPDPTIDDFTTTETLSNNGLIYWLKDLKPATKYYMRAYAKTSTGKAGYGEVIKFYTIPKGQITMTMRNGETTNTERIRQAAQTAIDWWNQLTEMKDYHPNIGYESGTPTADCSYGGYIRVGSNTSYQRTGTIMHEMLHGCGVIPWAGTEWAKFDLRSGTSNAAGYTTGSGLWLGDRVTEVLRFWDNSTTSQLNGDYQHMWPYGINGASEDNGSDVLYIGNGLVCQALGEDGLQHTNTLFAEPYYALNQEDDIKYYIKNESADRGLFTSYLIPTSTGALKWREMSSAEAAANDSTAWFITFTPGNQYYQFRNAATGQYLTYSSGFKTMTRTSLTNNENFHLMKGRVDVGAGSQAKRGYWIIHTTGNWNPSCLQANAAGATGSATFNIANSAENQRWLILTQDEMDEVEQAAIIALTQEAWDLLTPIKALAEVPHTEKEDGVDDEFNARVNQLEEILNPPNDIASIIATTAEINDLTLWYLSRVNPSDANHPFDLTYLIKNAGMDATEGWSSSPAISYSCAEFYQATFDFNQTISSLPAGKFTLSVQGFQRPGTSADSYADFIAGNNKVNALLYAGSQTQKISHIAEAAQTSKLGGSESSVGSPVRYMPYNMQAASIYFAKGLYENKVENTLATNGASLKIGIKSSSMPSNYWVIFDNFRLFFHGSNVPDNPDGLTQLSQNEETTSYTIYSLDGRIVRLNGTTTTGLRPGVYVQNGRKIIIK